jgi:hypothetical protein
MCRNCNSTLRLEDKYRPSRYGNDRMRALEEREDDARGMDDQNSWGQKRRREPHEACSRFCDTKLGTPLRNRCAVHPPLLKCCAVCVQPLSQTLCIPSPCLALCITLLKSCAPPCSSAAHLPTQALCTPHSSAVQPRIERCACSRKLHDN